MTDEQLADVRRYTSAEVVEMLNIPPKWLRELVRERRVPHQRTGPKKGVWFTAEDVLTIGGMLSDLMSPRRVSCEAGEPDAQEPAAAVSVPARPEPPGEMLTEWAQLQRTIGHPGVRRPDGCGPAPGHDRVGRRSELLRLVRV